MRKWFIIVILLILTGFGAWMAWVYFSKDAFLKAIYLVPKDAIYIVETEKPVRSWKNLSESEIWQFLRTHPSFADIDENARYLDSLINENETAFQLLGNRNLLISAHMTRARDYDFLYIIDLEKASKTGLLQDQAERLFKVMHFRVTQRQFENYEILEVYDPISRETFFLSFVANHALLSFSGALIEKSISESALPVIGRNLQFEDVTNRVSQKGLCRLYVQFSYIDDYLKCYGSSDNEFVKTLSGALSWMALDFDTDDNCFSLDGYTNLNDSVDSYLSALLQTGSGTLNAPELLPANTAFFVSLGIKNFQQFYATFLQELDKDPAAAKAYHDNYRKTEKLLKLDLKEDFLSWIGSEIIFASPTPPAGSEKQGYLVIIAPNDLSKAQAGMEHIMRQIKRRTPGKFKEKTYNEQPIYYLELKGLFRLFFGKLFGAMEKPYLTWYNDHLVMSNQMEVLQQYLDNQKSGKSLAADASFQELESRLSRKSNITVYLGLAKLFPSLKNYANPSTWADMQKSAAYIKGFPENAFQLTGDGKFFETRLFMLHQKEIKPEIADSSEVISDSTEAAPTTDSLNIEPAGTITGDKLITRYADGAIRSESTLSDGIKNGKHIEYHPNGKISVKGAFKDGNPDGIWKYYDENEKFIRKENF